MKQLSLLTEEAKMLETEANRGSESSGASPRRSPSQALRGSHLTGQRDLHSSADVRTVAGPSNRSKRGPQ